MAVDEAILEAATCHAVKPTLRLYSWRPYCLSIGHAQAIAEVNLSHLADLGWDLVRRPTGGRAILHADEITYSICAPLDDPNVKGGVLESYRHFSNCLLEALSIIGIRADSKPKDETAKFLSKDPVCFQYPSDYEITVFGKKIIGSAQARKKDGLLQHGAIPMFGDITRIISTLNFKSDTQRKIARLNLSNHATTIKSIIGYEISWNELSNAIISAFEEVLGIQFVLSTLTKGELKRAKELQKEKYLSDKWT
ncbi:MAG: lipoate--protein ligase family protein, partial [Anaerolineaceae bacterium]|nr:lipoate--protein ligase family protein [Anaerolineaceae bacterium]